LKQWKGPSFAKINQDRRWGEIEEKDDFAHLSLAKDTWVPELAMCVTGPSGEGKNAETGVLATTTSGYD